MKVVLKIAGIVWLALVASRGAEHQHDLHGTNTPAGQQKVIVVQYSGFDCTHCGEVSSLLDKLVSAQNLSLQVLFKHSPITPEALVAHEAALAAGQQGKFWQMHDLLFANPKANYSQLLEMAKILKLDVKRFQTALDEREFREKVMMDIVEARGLGIRVTPTIFVNGTKLEGIEQIRSMVNAALNSPQDAPDSDVVHKFELTGSPSFGPEDAPVTVTEFSDFRCHYCGEHSKVITDLVAAYPGKIRRVFKHFPIQVNADGKLPHMGAMAAHAQGQFWPMYRALMNRPLAGRDDLISRAVAIGLDMQRFERDLAAADSAALVQRDIDEGDRVGIRMTPTTFINGRMVNGRQTLDALKQRVDKILTGGSAQVAVGATNEVPPVECCGK